MSVNLEPDVPASGNPSGLDGIELVESATARPLAPGHGLERMGVPPVVLPRRPSRASRERIP